MSQNNLTNKSGIPFSGKYGTERRDEVRMKKDVPFVFIHKERNINANTVDFSKNGVDIKIFDNYYTLWSLPQVQISVIPACPESFRKDSRRALLAGMTPMNKHSNNGRPAVSAAGFFTIS